MQQFLKIFFKDNGSKFGFMLVSIILILTFIVPVLLATNYSDINLDNVLKQPNSKDWFGTDQYGRDYFTRVLYGGRNSLISSFIIISSAVLLGFLFGIISGFYGGIMDEVVMRICDLIMSFPPFILAMAIAFTLGPGLKNTVLALIILWWPSYARLVRGVVLSIKEKDIQRDTDRSLKNVR